MAQFPKDTEPEKGFKWHMDVAKTLEQIWMRTYPMAGGRSRVLDLAKYATGYMALTPTGNNTLLASGVTPGTGSAFDGEVVPKAHIGANRLEQDDMLSVIPMLLGTVMGVLSKQELRPLLVPIDAASNDVRRDYEAIIRTYKAFAESGMQFTDLLKQIGLTPDQVPDDDDELRMLLQTRPVFKQAMNGELFLEQVFAENNLEVVARQYQLYLATLGWGAVKCSYINGEHVLERCPMEDFIFDLRYLQDGNARYYGVVRYLKVGEIIERAKESNGGRGLTDDQIKELNAKRGSGWWYQNQAQQLGDFTGDVNDSVPVLDFEYYSLLTIIERTKLGQDGFPRTYIESNRKPTSPEVLAASERIISEQVYTANAWYGGQYVIGTNIMYNWGLVEGQGRDPLAKDPRDMKIVKPWKAMSSFYFDAPDAFAGAKKSMVEQMVPVARQIQRTWKNLSALMQRYTPYKEEIDMGLMAEISSSFGGGKAISPQEVIRIYKTEHILLKNTVATKMHPNASGRAIELVPTPDAQQLQFLVGQLNSDIALLRSITGVTGISSGQIQSAEITNSTQMLALQGTDNVLEGIASSSRRMVEYFSKLIVCREQYLRREREGVSGTQPYKLDESFHDTIMGVKVVVKPTVLEKQRFEQAAAAALARQAITQADYFFVLNIDNIHQAEEILAVREAKRTRAAQEAAAQNQQMTIQGQQESAMATHQMKMEQIKAEIDGKIMLQRIENDGLLAVEALRAQAAQNNNMITPMLTEAVKAVLNGGDKPNAKKGEEILKSILNNAQGPQQQPMQQQQEPAAVEQAEPMQEPMAQEQAEVPVA